MTTVKTELTLYTPTHVAYAKKRQQQPKGYRMLFM